jgi:nucleotide-binding universal stress UspA family protein
MKILVPVDGSEFTKKALDFLMTHSRICGPEDELMILHVHSQVPPHARGMLSKQDVDTYYEEESKEVLDPVRSMLEGRKLNFKAGWRAGSPATEIVQTAMKEGAEMIVMGTHGHGVLGRALMGSVAQKVINESKVPVLLVK